MMLAGVVAGIGAVVVVRGLAREWRGLRGPVTDPATGAAFVRALRSVLGGGALVAIAAGWAFDVRPLLVLGLVIGAEEMLEIGVVVAAMNDAERRPGSPWRFRSARIRTGRPVRLLARAARRVGRRHAPVWRRLRSRSSRA